MGKIVKNCLFRGPQWCRQQLVEYSRYEEFNKNLTYDRSHYPHFVHPEGKDGQLLGTVVVSSAISKGVAGRAVVSINGLF